MPVFRLVTSALIVFVLMNFASAATNDDPVRGYWGGESVSLFATAAGADGDFHCSFGRMLEPIYLDEAGQFSVSGFIDFYEGGAHPATRIPAIFSGIVKKKLMQLRIVLKNGLVWEFNLLRGDLGKVKKCY